MRPYSHFACLVIFLAVGCREATPKRSSSAKPAPPSVAHAERVEKEARNSLANSQPAAQAQAAFDEAQRNVSAKRYDDALANYVRLLETAPNIDRAYNGVLLFSALRNWKQLGDVYPAAKTKLIEVRDEAERKVKNDDDAIESFDKFAAINSVLGEDQKTVALFKILDKDNVQAAGEAFEAARPALIKAGELQLCGTYADPKDYPRLVERYHQLLNLPADSIIGENRAEFAQKSFSNSVTTLVALLVLSDRKANAEGIAAAAKTVWSNKLFAEALDRALKGEVPVQQ
jgi:tetratricopeptide (TPR) repeat protein